MNQGDLDSAVIRRFSSVIHIPPPTPEDQIALMKLQLNGFTAVTDEEFTTLKAFTSGFSGSDTTRAVDCKYHLLL